MSKKLITLHPKDKVKRAKEIFEEYDIRHIPIAVMNKVVGIMSKGDILYLEGVVTNGFDKFIQESMLNSMTIDQVMTTNVVSAKSDQSINDVINVMVELKINAIPVVKEDELVGLVTTFDIMKSLIK
jgi:CBS domain-containing protein